MLVIFAFKVLLKEKSHLHLGWPEGELIIHVFFGGVNHPFFRWMTVVACLIFVFRWYLQGLA